MAGGLLAQYGFFDCLIGEAVQFIIGRIDRQIDRKGRSFADFAVNQYPAVVLSYNLSDNRQRELTTVKDIE